MAEREIDLSDYLKVLWRYRWFISALVFFTSFSVGILTWAQPDTFRIQTLIELKPIPRFDPVNVPTLEPDQVNLLIDSDQLLNEVIKSPELEGYELKLSWISRNVTIRSPNKATRELGLTGTFSPQVLTNIIEQLIFHLNQALSNNLENQLETEYDRIRLVIEMLKANRQDLQDTLQQELNARLAFWEAERARLLDELERMTSQYDLSVQVGEMNTTLAGVIARQGFENLYEQLAYVNVEVIRLRARGDDVLPSKQDSINEITRQIDTLQRAKEQVKGFFSQKWEPLKVVASPLPPEQPMSSPWLANALVAGVLALFSGVLISFLIFYLREESRVA